MKNLYKVLFVLFIFSLFSCEIGLGSAVDTEPPTLNIATPISDAVIRDAFRFTGTWSDDGTIAGLQIYLESPDGSASYGPFEGTVIESEDENAENTWYCVINPKEAGITDGSYEAKISITDEGEHTTTQSRQLTIDNTPPIIVLQRPSSKSTEEAADSYGQTFTLEGQAADDNNVSSIRVNIFADADCTQLVHTVVLNNVPPTISLDVAKFGDENYSKIYGTGKDGTKQYYCTLVAYDGAARYPADGSNQTPEDLLGNAITSYYLYEDIATDILSNHKITEVYHMLNGAYLSGDVSRSAETVNSVTSILNSKVVTAGRFSLNPENNPKFSVSGHSILKGDGSDFTTPEHSVSNGGSIVIEVATGLDGIPLIGDSLKPYFIPCDAYGNPISGAERTEPKYEVTKSGTSYKFVVTLSTTDGMKIGTDYILGIAGTDQERNSVVPDKGGKGYGFHLSSSGAAPILNITSPENSISYIKSGVSLPIAGTVTVEEGIPLITILNGATEVYRSAFTAEEAAVIDDKKQYSFSFMPTYGSESSQNSFTIKAYQEGQSTTLTKTIMFDKDAPTIQLLNLAPVANKYDDAGAKVKYIDDSAADNYTYLNGTITFKSSVTDDFDTVASAKWELIQNGEVKQSGYFENPTSAQITVDTTTLDDEKNVTLKITGSDRAGNSAEAKYYYKVDQSTDKPIILANDQNLVDFTITDYDKLKEANNLKNVFVNGQQLMLKLIDDDSLKSITVSKGEFAKKTTKTGFTYEEPASLTKDVDEAPVGGPDYVYPYPLPSTSGIYKFEIELNDTYGKSSGKKYIVIKTTPAAPDVSVESDRNWINPDKADDKFNVTITIDSEQGPFKIERSKNSENWKTIKEGLSDLTYKDEDEDIKKPASTSTYYYKVTDVNNHSSTSKFVKLGVDSKVDELAPGEMPNKENTKNASFTFRGTAKDNESGLSKVEIKIDGKKNGIPVSKTIDAIGTTDWFYELTYSDSNLNGVFDEQGPKTVTFTVYDNVGNSKTSTGTFTYDNANPNLYVDPSTIREFIPSAGYDITGTASDSYEFAELTVKEYCKQNAVDGYTETAESKAGKHPAVDITTHKWIQHVPFGTLKDGYYKYEFIAEDSVGNIVTETKEDIQVDQSAPTATVTAPDAFTKYESYTFKGTAYDPNLDKVMVYLQEKDGSGNWNDVANQKSEVSPSRAAPYDWEWKVYDLTDGEYRVRIEATDKAGNSVGTQTVVTSAAALTVDLTAPAADITATGLVKSDGTALASATNISADSEIKYYAKESATPASAAPFTISGVITETNYDKAKVTLSAKKDDVTITAPALTFESDTKKWSFAPVLAADGTKDGTYKYTITIKDKAENRTDYIVNVVYDSQKPTVSITDPADGQIINNSTITAQGAIRDSGIGLKSLEYSVDGQSTWQPITISPQSTSWSKQWTGLNEGAINLILKATDLLGHETLSNAIRFSYDEEEPQLEYNSLNNYYRTGNITLSGTAYDTNLLKSIVIKEGSTVIATKDENKSEITVDKSLNEAKASTSKLTWLKDLAVSGIQDGTHTYTVILTDDAGRTKEQSHTLIVDKTLPTIKLDALPNNNDTLASSYTFTGTAEDVTSGIDEIIIKIAGTKSGSPVSYEEVVNGTQVWNYTVTYSDDKWKDVFAEEGVKTVTLYIKDKAGNEERSFKCGNEGTNVSSKTFTYDTQKPSLDVDTSTIRAFIPSTGYDISGTASDSYKFANLTVKESYKASAAGSYEETTESKTGMHPTVNSSTHTWTQHVPFGTLKDGYYKYEFIAKDEVGNVSTFAKDNIQVDQTSPEATVTSPDSYTKVENYIFRGTAYDLNLDKVTVYLQKKDGSGNWNDVANQKSEVTPASTSPYGWEWKVYDLIEDGEYRVRIEATDKAGNSVGDITKSQPIVTSASVLTVDLTAPTAVITATGLVKSDGTALASATNISADSEIKYYAKESATPATVAPFTISGVITETNYDKAKVTLSAKKDDVNLSTAPVLKFESDTRKWSFAPVLAADGTKDGTYKYTITIKDMAENRTDYIVNVVYDSQKPTVSITDPADGQIINNSSITAQGAVRDNGIGLSKLEYSVDSGANWNSLEGITAQSTSWSKQWTGLNEGAINLILKATDLLGHETLSNAIRFSYDKNPPVVTFTEPAKYYNTGSITLTGTAYDTNLLKKVTISDEYTTTSTNTEEYDVDITNGAYNTAKADGTKLTWSKTFNTSTFGDGTHKFTVIATDDAGRTNSVTYTSIVDTKKPNVTLEAIPSRTDTQANNFTFRGTAEDATSGVDKVELTITGKNSSGTDVARTVKVTGKENWYYTVSFADDTLAGAEAGASGATWKEVFATEGEKIITIKATDKAALYQTDFTFADRNNTIASKTFTYDKENPSFNINGNSILEYMPETGFTVTGIASDSYKLSGTTEGFGSIVVAEYHKGTATGASFVETAASKDSTKNTFNVTSVTNHSGNISIPLPLNLAGLSNGKPADGTYKYSFTLKDSVGNSTVFNINEVIVDTTAPRITVSTPATDTTKTGTNAINETNFRFDGTITEANVVAGVYYKIIKDGDSEPVVPTGNKILASTWTNSGWTAATAGTASWSGNQTFNSGKTSSGSSLSEGKGYKLYAYAVDKAGNVGNLAQDNTTKAIRTFDVDLSYPTVETRIGKANGNSKTTLETSTTQIKTDGYTFDFKVSDTFDLDSTNPYTVELKKDDVTLGTATKTDTPYYTVGSVSGGYYPITITVPEGVKGDGLYEYTIIAKDAVGKTTSVTRNIRLDTKAPDLEILSPDLNDYQNSEKVTVKGSAEDDSGTYAVWYAYGVNSEPTVPSTNTKVDNSWTTNSWNKASGTTSWTISELPGTEGTGKKLFVRAVDKNGLVSGVKTGTINIDLSNPDSTTDETALIKNGNFVFEGTVWDKNGIESVTIVQSGQASATYSTDSNIESTPSINVTDGNSKLALAKSDAAKATWTKSFDVSSLDDGIYNFSIKVKDIAGKETIKSRTVTVDETDPTIRTSTLTWTDSPVTGAAHTVKTATLKVSPTDENLDTVYYFVNDGSNTSITGPSKVSTTLWETIIPTEKTVDGVKTTVYEKDVTFADGDGTVYIKVTDKAGNESYDTTLKYEVDTTKPEKPTLNTVDGETLTETKMINGSSVVEFVLTARDQNDHYNSGNKVGLDATKVASVNLSKIGVNSVTPNAATNGQGQPTLSESTKTGEWTITIPTTAFAGLSAGNTPVYVTVTDISGNYDEFEMFSIELDNVKPVPAVTTPNASTINGTLDVTGTVTETYPKSVGLYYRPAAPDSSDNSDKTISGWTKIEEIVKDVNSATVSDISKFTFKDVDFNTLSGAKTADDKKHDIYLLVYSEDTAGNASVIENKWKKYDVDMDEDRPVIKFSNISLGSTMASDSRVGFENSELYGSVTDDDGVPEIVQYYIGASAPAADSTDWIAPAANSNFIYSNGSFTLKFLDSNGKPDDGEKNIFFKVVDKAGTAFISSASTTYDSSSVKVTDGTNEYGARLIDNSQTPPTVTTTASAVYLKVDTQAPDVYNEGYYLGASVTDETKWSTAIAAATFGGTQNQFLLRQYAYDANGVTSVKARIPTVQGDTSTVTGYANTGDTVKPSVTRYYEYNFTKQTGSGSTTTTPNGTEYTKWISTAINVSGMKSGTRQCEIIVSDGIKSKTTPVNISIDNDAPVVVVESQTENEQMRAAFLMKGQFQDGDLGTQLWYKLSTSSATPDSWSTNPVAATTAMNWRIAFDGDQNPQDAYTHDGVPKEIIASLLSDNVEIATTGTYTGKAVWKTAGTGHSAGDLYTPITTVYFHFKVQDRLGNESTTYIPLKLDPQGDIPVITRLTPEETTLGGTIRFSGSAEDDATIAGLYVEVDPHYGWNDTTSKADATGSEVFRPWSSTHKTPAYTKGDETVTAKAPEEVITTTNYPNNPYELINAKVADGKKKTTTVKAIYIGNGLSWNIALNKYGEWNGAATNTVAVRFYAVDVDGNMSEPTDPFVFAVDSDKPKIGNTEKFYLKKYSNNATGTGDVTASIEYTDGMWLKGEWWLEGSVEDENGITTVTMNGTSIADSSTAVSKGTGTNQWPNTSGYRTHYKVGSTNSTSAGQLVYTLAITDGDNKDNSKDFVINYDNKAPTLAETTDENYSISTTVKNSNGFYTIRSAVVEESSESGFDKVVFYFKRTTTGYQNVYDSYMAKTYTDGETKKTDKNQFAYSGDSAGVSYDEATCLYWRTATVSSVSGNTVTLSAADVNIHVGGLVKVDGTIYTIKGISGTTLTLSGNPTESFTGTIYYAIGHVVDHAGAESAGTNAGKITTINATNKGYGYGYYGNSPDDDGDMMIETVSTTGTRTIWSASINSNNIPDGPIELHYVAFDKAGNVAHGVVGASTSDYDDAQVADSTAASVANNAPRLAGVTIWSDYNGNGKGWRNSGDHEADYASETKSKYFSRVRPSINGQLTDRSNDVTSKLIVSNNDYGIEDDTDGTAYMKVTDTVKFIPEIVGGNGQLYYDYKIGKKSAFTVTSGAITAFTASTTTGSKALKGGTADSQLPLKNDSNANVSGNDEGDEYTTVTDPNTTLKYVDGHTNGVITFTADDVLSNLDNTTTEDPTWFDIKIWDSTEGGTPYSNTLNCEMQIALMNKYNDENRPHAWIRPFFWKQSGKPSSGMDLYNSISWDSDGNAEGHIELEGDLTAAIKTALGATNPKVSGKIKIEGYAYDDIKLGKLYVSFDDHSSIGSKTQASTYDGTWSPKTYANGWGFEAEDVYCNADGHLVHWILTVDTAARSKKVGTGKAVKIYAEGARGGDSYKNSVAPGTTQTVNLAQFVWSAVKSDKTNKYYTTPDRTVEATTANTLDDAIVYANAYEYQWLNVKGGSGTYYTDLACTTATTDATADTAKVYQKATYTWNDVKSSVTPATQTTYFTDAACTTLANATTADTARVYKNTMTSTYNLDIVPYITGVDTALKEKLKSSIRNAYTRTSLGNYVVRSNETVVLKGFNLSGMKYGTDTTELADAKDSSNNVIGKSLPMSKLSTSGAPVLKVGDIEILNNSNNDNAKGSYSGTINDSSSYDVKNTYAYNRQPNKTSNNLLTDDIKFDVWEFDSDAAKPVSGELREPVMRINPMDGRIGFAFVSGPADFSMANGASSGATSYSQWQHNYATFSNVSFVYDSAGYSHGTTTGLDTYPDGSQNTLAGRFTYVTSRWGISSTTDKDDNYKKDKKQRLEAIGVPKAGTYKYKNQNSDNRYFYVNGSKPSSYTMTETRFASPTIAATVHNDKAAVYLAYYDSVQNQIRFRYTSEVKSRGTDYNSADSDQFVDNIGFSDNLISGSDDSKHVFDSYTENFSLLAGKDWQRKANGNKVTSTDNNLASNAFFDTGFTADKYVAIDATTDANQTTSTAANDIVVAVWYDGTDCWYAYTNNPTSGVDVVKGTDNHTNGWSNPVKIFSEGGEFCTVKLAPGITASGTKKYSVHIAAQVDGALRYVYLDNYNSVSGYNENTQSVLVDSYAVTGEQINLDVGLKTVNSKTVAVPSISYYMGAAKLPVVATLVVPSTGTVDYTAQGTVDDIFTGNWNVSAIPSPSKLTGTSYDKINIGLWKKNGMITTPSTFDYYVNKTNTDNTSTTTTGGCYGNNTENPVLGYAIISTTGTCIETAQMK